MPSENSKLSPVFQSLPGFFVQDDLPQIGSTGVLPRLGLLDESPDRWVNFIAKIARLNAAAVSGTSYKVLFMSRHGQGYHNVAEEKYGTETWDDYWSKLNGDGDIVWGPDPLLTPLGEVQAEAIKKEWSSELSFGIPVPERLYCSPLTRALRTCEIIFSDRSECLCSVIVTENCREMNGGHTCDRRRTRSEIAASFPLFQFEPSFAEEDELWDADVRETGEQVVERATAVLKIIFKDPSTYISITAHSGFIHALLLSLGRPKYPLATGGVLPVVVKCTIRPTRE